MENRFGLKDLVLFALLAGLAGLVALAMVQYDRQWSTLQNLSHKLDEQSGDLAALRRTLDHGVAMGPTTPAAGTAADDPSARVRAATTRPGYAAHDWYVASGPNSDKLTPLVSGDAFANAIQNRVLETLVTRDPVSLQWVPLLALPGWTVEDHIADWHRYVDPKVAAGAKVDDVGREAACPCPIRVTYHLRPGVTFSDGVPLTADDVKWTFDWTMNPAVEAPRARSALDKVKRVVRTGTDGVTFELSEPYFDPVELTGTNFVLPRHVYGPVGPDAFNKSTGLLLGSGRYQFAVDPRQRQWTPGTTVELVRNERYWGEPAALSKLVYKIIVSDLARLTAFTNGELDTFAANPVQYRSLLANADVTARARHLEYETPNTGYRYIAWNEERGGKPTRFADRRVRLAMTLLCDRRRICDEAMLGLASVATGPFNKLGKQNDPSVQPWPFDPARARALLKEVGVHRRRHRQPQGPRRAAVRRPRDLPAGVAGVRPHHAHAEGQLRQGRGQVRAGQAGLVGVQPTAQEPGLRRDQPRLDGRAGGRHLPDVRLGPDRRPRRRLHELPQPRAGRGHRAGPPDARPGRAAAAVAEVPPDHPPGPAVHVSCSRRRRSRSSTSGWTTCNCCRPG